MDAFFFDAISWIGLALCIGAFFIKDVFMLRLTTTVGCIIMTAYYTHISVPQGVISNIIIVVVNGIYLMRMVAPKQSQVVDAL